ncbi:MAG TPA: carbamoyltransferase HypF [Candidatus Binataceae bacterium]
MNQADSIITPGATPVIRTLIRVEGIVQGVGFRPFIYALARRLGLGGYVANDQRGVIIEVEGDPALVHEFIARAQNDAPVLASVDGLSTTRIAALGEGEFSIVGSRAEGPRQTLIAPDTATCADCLREIFDRCDRRYRYPFTNCTNCGPRFTIIRDTPYDRPFTTMAGFAMCALCAREYHDPGDRRFHAQPISCPDCGPRLRLIDGRDPHPNPLPGEGEGVNSHGDVVDHAARLLAAGHIIAIKGLGGYHLAAAAANESAVGALRARKHREDKPFAVMAADIRAARRLAFIDEAEERALCGARRPIVLVRRRPHAPIAAAVAPGNRFIGAMLPYTPLHHLLCDALGYPIVLTSGNVSDEPIAYCDDDAIKRLGAIADFFLTHDRPIHIRTDDSVVRVFSGREMPIRRSRGYAPAPLKLPLSARRPILSCGGELKSTFCLVRDRSAFLSHHVGDLENYQSLRAFTEGIEHFRRLFELSPKIVVHDLHPEYLSTKYAMDLRGVELIAVQHHHAHIAACLADNGEWGPAIGVAFDGLGYGADSTMWGGEFLIADLCGFQRAGHFEPAQMPGGTAAIRQPWRMALAYLDPLYGNELPPGLEVFKRNRSRWSAVAAAMRARVNSPMTSSAGRLFDAAAAIAGSRDEVNYEGQAAVEFEQMADITERGAYPHGVIRAGTIRISGAALVRALAEDVMAGTPREIAAARFHNGMAQAIVTVCDLIRGEQDLNTVALSGGVFQNALLLERTSQRLLARGFRVLTHSQVPANDGGIAFGQAAIAAARDSGQRAVCRV